MCLCYFLILSLLIVTDDFVMMIFFFLVIRRETETTLLPTRSVYEVFMMLNRTPMLYCWAFFLCVSDYIIVYLSFLHCFIRVGWGVVCFFVFGD